jgi:hypothetical protein
MALIKAIHIECDSCNARISDIATSRHQRYGGPTVAVTIRRMRNKGWTHGKRDLCPKCQPHQRRHSHGA